MSPHTLEVGQVNHKSAIGSTETERGVAVASSPRRDGHALPDCALDRLADLTFRGGVNDGEWRRLEALVESCDAGSVTRGGGDDWRKARGRETLDDLGWVGALDERASEGEEWCHEQSQKPKHPTRGRLVRAGVGQKQGSGVPRQLRPQPRR